MRSASIIVLLLVCGCESTIEPVMVEPPPAHAVTKKPIRARRKKAPVAKAPPAPVIKPAAAIFAPPLIDADPPPPPAPPPLIEAELPEPPGGNGEEIARSIARAKRSAIRACYERELKLNPKLEGTVTVELELAPPQTVESVRVRDDLGRPELTACVERVMQQLRFPPLDEAVSVALPFALKPVL